MQGDDKDNRQLLEIQRNTRNKDHLLFYHRGYPTAVWSVFIVEEEKAMKTIYLTYAWKSEP